MATLKVEGAVAEAREFGFADLEALPGQVVNIATLVPGREGGAVALRSLLEVVAVDASATHLTLESTDGRFAASTPLAEVADAVLSYRLGDEPLPKKHGGPIRFFIPEVEACASGPVDACANVKFLGTIRLDIGAGRDTRPTNEGDHAELHRRES